MVIAVNSVAAVKATVTSDLAVALDAPGLEGFLFWTAGDFSGQADDVDVIASDYTPLSGGAWIRQGAKSIAYLPSDANAARQAVSERLEAHLSLPDFRHPSDTDDTAAWGRALAALAARGGGSLYLPAGKGLGSDGAYRSSGFWGFRVSASNIRIHGDGKEATVLENVGTGHNVIGLYGGTFDRVALADMTVRSRNGGNAFYANEGFSASGWLIERVIFEGEAEAAFNTVHLIHEAGCDGLDGSFSAHWTWVDCEFRSSPRMGIEIQNHRHDDPQGKTVSGYTRHLFVRPRIENIGGATAVPGFGMSFSGRGSGICVVDPFFRTVSAALIELIGVSDFYARNVMFVPETVAGTDALVRGTNDIPMRNITIDGLFPVTDEGDELTGAEQLIPRPALRFDNVTDLLLNRIVVPLVDYDDPDGAYMVRAIRLGVNFPNRNVRIVNSRIGASGQYIVTSDGGSVVVENSILKSSWSGNGIEGLRGWDNTLPGSHYVVRHCTADFASAGVLCQPVGGATGYAAYDATYESERALAVGAITVTPGTGSLPLPSGAVSIADAAAPTPQELLKLCIDLKAKVEEVVLGQQNSGQMEA